MKRMDWGTIRQTTNITKPNSAGERARFLSVDPLKLPEGAIHLNRKRIAPPRGHLADAAAVFISEPLISYKPDPKLARDESVLITVKTTLQVHKNDRQEEQMRRPAAEVFGREVARRYVHGFVAAFSLSHDCLSWNLSEADWAFSAVEPYAVDTCGDKMVLSGGNYVWVTDLVTGRKKLFQHPWLSQVHTAQFSRDGRRLLVASAGFDAVFEFEAETGQILWEWFAWEHGFENSQLGHYVVRSRERSEELRASGKDVLFVENPREYEYGIPTRMCPAHLNSAAYDSDGTILVTLFHQGAGIAVHKKTGKARTIVSGMVNPHKLVRRRNGGYFVSDTRRGKLLLTDTSGRPAHEIALTGMPGLERSPKLSEFLQNTTELKPDLFASVDIHRNSLWLIDVKQRRYRGIKFPAEWSMHDVTSVTPKQSARIGNIVGRVFGKVEAGERAQKIIRHYSPDGREDAALILDGEGRSRELHFQM
jgi:hypothetical protein